MENPAPKYPQNHVSLGLFVQRKPGAIGFPYVSRPHLEKSPVIPLSLKAAIRPRYGLRFPILSGPEGIIPENKGIIHPISRISRRRDEVKICHVSAASFSLNGLSSDPSSQTLPDHIYGCFWNRQVRDRGLEKSSENSSTRVSDKKMRIYQGTISWEIISVTGTYALPIRHIFDRVNAFGYTFLIYDHIYICRRHH